MDDSHDEFRIQNAQGDAGAFAPAKPYDLDETSGAFANLNNASDSVGVKSAEGTLLKFQRQSLRSKQAEQTRAVIIGSSPAAQKLRDQIRLYANEDSPVLVNGETGVGKELIARELHHQSDRRKNAFVPVNVGAIPETLAAAHLFGHERGAFTDAVAEREGAFAAANGGVLFLDEIGDMPFSIQAHLLRVLDDGLVAKLGAKSPRGTDFRLICATNVNLKDSVKGGRFRRDLYYRINVLVIDAPPLRERGDDVIEIFEAMIASHRNEDFRTIKLTPKAGDKLRAYAFPGNVRELRNVLARALVHSRGGKILPSDLVFDDLGGIAGETSFDVGDAKEKIGRFLILKALKTANGNVTQAAALTGRSRGTVQTVKKKLGGEDFAKAYKAVCADIKALLDGC